MTAIQTGSAAGSAAGAGMVPSVPAPLPGLIPAFISLSVLLMMVNLIQLAVLLLMYRMLKKHQVRLPATHAKVQEDPKPTPSPEEVQETTDLSKYGNEKAETCSHTRDPDVTSAADSAYDPTRTGEESSNIPCAASRLPPESEDNGTTAVYSPRTDIPFPTAPSPLYPVEISSTVFYNAQLPAQFHKASGKKTVFTLWNDQTIRPSDDCFKGFNSITYYSQRRFPSAYDFVDRQGAMVDLSKTSSMKLIEVVNDATVSIKDGVIRIEKKGKIKVEVMK